MKTFLSRSRWAAVGAAIAVSLGGGAVFVANALEEGTVFVPIKPCRLLDTRANTIKGVAVDAPKDTIGNASIGVTPDRTKPQIANDLVVYFDPDARATMGDCQSLEDIPVEADPKALVMNVTAEGAGSGSFISVYPWQPMAGLIEPDAASRPFVSQLNPMPHPHPFANMITVGLVNENGSGPRAFRIYNHAGRVNVIIDVVGYFR